MSNKTIITIGILIVISFVGYTVFMKGDEEDTGEVLGRTSTATSTSAQGQVGAEILSALASLEKLKNIDVGFFNNPVFQQLKPSNQKVPNLPVGRKNPFAPIGAPGSALPAASSTVR